jgi:hypothetical protein
MMYMRPVCELSAPATGSRQLAPTYSHYGLDHFATQLSGLAAAATPTAHLRIFQKVIKNYGNFSTAFKRLT